MRRLPLVALVLLSCSKGSTPDIAPIALTPTEYNHTVRDLLGLPDDGREWPAAPALLQELAPPGEQVDAFGVAQVTPVWPWPLPEEPGHDDFEGFEDGQAPSAYQLEELQKAALSFGAYTLVAPEFFTCTDWSGSAELAQQSCGLASIERFAARAWRRPLTEQESTRLKAFWQTQWAAGTPEEAVALTAAGLLQAPQFLFKLQGLDSDKRRGREKLDDFELATRLSYFLWDTMPDEELFRAATAGELSKRGGLQEQVERMLADDKARGAVAHFHHQWLGTEEVLQITPSRAQYGPVFGLNPDPPLDTNGDEEWPAVLGPLRHAMRAEVDLFVGATVFDGAGTLQALLTDHHSWVSDQTELVYGEVVPLDLPQVDLDVSFIAASGGTNDAVTMVAATLPASERAGLLTLPAVLAIGSHPVHPSPILRGKRILERVTCTELGTPPAGAEAFQPSDSVEAASTNRSRTEVATEAPGCAGCHDTLNPMGFAFEHYDSLGAYRSQDNGLPVDASGSVRLREQTLHFTDAVDLSAQLAALPQVQQCYAQRWLDYAIGVPVDPTDPDAARLISDFEKEDDVLGLLQAIATSEFFRYRAAGGGA